jgi:hypothetical protein
MIPPLADVAERRDYGKSRRQVLHRDDQCHWKPPRTRPDPFDLLVDAGRDRLSELLPIRWARMAASPFGFFRGAVPCFFLGLIMSFQWVPFFRARKWPLFSSEIGSKTALQRPFCRPSTPSPAALQAATHFPSGRGFKNHTHTHCL